MAVVNKKKLLAAYKKVDLFRAKYRHQDLTPHAWCFHGNEAQEWTGVARDHRLEINKSTSKVTNINASTYKYVSFALNLKEVWINDSSSTIMSASTCSREGGHCDIYYDWISGCKIDNTFKYDVPTANKEFAVKLKVKNNLLEEIEKLQPISFNEDIVYFDMSNEAGWAGTITNVEITILIRTKGSDTWMTTIQEVGGAYCPVVELEYFKVDKINVFKEVNDNQTITENDINYLRNLMDAINKTPIDWNKKGPIDDRVKKFISVVKSNDLDSIINKIDTVAPYNGCSTCDEFTCACYQTKDGWVGCKTCDGCNAYTGCSVACDQACYSEATTCTCYNVAYQIGRSCTCYQTSYQYTCKCYNKWY